MATTVEPRFNEPLYNEVLDITNDFLQPGQNYSKMYGTKPWYSEPRYNEIHLITNRIQKPKCGKHLDIHVTNKCQHVTKDECETDQQGWHFFNPVTRGQQPITVVYIISPFCLLKVLLISLSLMASCGKRNTLLEFPVQCPYFFVLPATSTDI